MRLIPALSLVLLCGCFVGKLVHASGAVRDLRSLCEEKDKVKITRLSHVHKLASQLEDKAYDGVCSQHVRDALKELDILVQNTRACSIKKAESITDFYNRHIKEALEDEASTEAGEVAAESKGASAIKKDKLPRPIVDFVLAYGLKVSVICRRHMLETFLEAAKKLITGDDRNELSLFTKEDSPLDRLLRTIAKPGEFLLPVDVFRVVPGTDREHLYLKDKNTRQLLRAKELCKRRFQPMYEESLKPIAILARSGFDLRTLQMKADMWVIPFVSSEIFTWTKIVFLCESLSTMDIVLEPTETCAINGETVTKPAQDPNSQTNEISRIARFKPDEEIGDKIIGKLDFQLKKAVESFDPTKNSVKRLEEKIAQRAWQLLLEKSKNGNHLEALKEFIEGISSCKNDPDLDQLKAELAKLSESEGTSKLHSLVMVGKTLHILLFYITVVPILFGPFYQPASHSKA